MPRRSADDVWALATPATLTDTPATSKASKRMRLIEGSRGRSEVHEQEQIGSGRRGGEAVGDRDRLRRAVVAGDLFDLPQQCAAREHDERALPKVVHGADEIRDERRGRIAPIGDDGSAWLIGQ